MSLPGTILSLLMQKKQEDDNTPAQRRLGASAGASKVGPDDDLQYDENAHIFRGDPWKHENDAPGALAASPYDAPVTWGAGGEERAPALAENPYGTPGAPAETDLRQFQQAPGGKATLTDTDIAGAVQARDAREASTALPPNPYGADEPAAAKPPPVQDRSPEELDEYIAARGRIQAGRGGAGDAKYVRRYEMGSGSALAPAWANPEGSKEPVNLDYMSEGDYQTYQEAVSRIYSGYGTPADEKLVRLARQAGTQLR